MQKSPQEIKKKKKEKEKKNSTTSLAQASRKALDLIDGW